MLLQVAPIEVSPNCQPGCPESYLLLVCKDGHVVTLREMPSCPKVLMTLWKGERIHAPRYTWRVILSRTSKGYLVSIFLPGVV